MLDMDAGSTMVPDYPSETPVTMLYSCAGGRARQPQLATAPAFHGKRVLLLAPAGEHDPSRARERLLRAIFQQARYCS